MRYSSAQKDHEMLEQLHLAGQLYNHKIMGELRRHFRAWNIYIFYTTAEKVMRVQCGNPVVRSVIVGDQLISDRDQVYEAIAEYFQGVYGIQDHVQHIETEEDLTMWSRFEAAV